jgi:hypothetical protein
VPLVFVVGLAAVAHAGGQGRELPPIPLPVHHTQVRVASQVPMVCVDAPATPCATPYLDAPPNASNTDGGTFRSASCPSGASNRACRPDYIAGAELTGELVVDWPITRLENVAQCGPSPSYEICHDGLIQLNVTAPGVVVSNPLVEIDDERCGCIERDGFIYTFDAAFSGYQIEPYWSTRNVGASCDIALEYATLVPRAQIVSIAQQAFPSELCDDQGSGCTIEPEIVFVEPDGSLTKGCGTAPGNTFAIRFTLPNTPLDFEEKPLVGASTVFGDVDGDDAIDTMSTADTVQLNDGSNAFTATSTGLPSSGIGVRALGDWTGDGDTDLAGAVSGSLRIYPGDGAGGFDSGTSSTIDSGTSFDMQLVDLNADGRPDVFSTSSSSRIVWNPNGGPISPSADTPAIATRALADLDGDEDADLLGASGSDPITMQWAENAGPGSFAVQTATTVANGTEQLAPFLGQATVDRLRCDPYASDCCSANGTAGCDDAACEAIVCNQDFFCCSGSWDETCRDIALEQCGACMPAGTPDCCVEHGYGGCSVSFCQTEICGAFPECCNGDWDDFCADRARGLCNECQGYNVQCQLGTVDLDAADVDGDGDADICAFASVDLRLLNSAQDEDAVAGYFAWLPNLQVDDPVASGGAPLFDPVTAPWQPVGPVPVSDDADPANGPLVLADLDADGDPDAVGEGFWYRNDAGVFSGPFALTGAPPRPSGPSDPLLVIDAEGDGDLDVISGTRIYAPEPGMMALFATGLATLVALGRRHRRR